MKLFIWVEKVMPLKVLIFSGLVVLIKYMKYNLHLPNFVSGNSYYMINVVLYYSLLKLSAFQDN